MTTLYEGLSQGYVKCLSCGYESLRPDKFQDLSLPIKNEFGTGVLNSSVEMALENYIKPEILSGDNQYRCEGCGNKVDAEKGTNIVSGPPILTIALNRFTFDLATFARVKLLEYVSFNGVLNLNDYL
jgi:ubiquitin C-terminal hydrolase